MSTIEIRSLIDLAVNRLHELNLKQATIQTYWQRSFNFIIRRYEECHKTYYDQALMDELLHQYAAQAEAGSISRKSYRWRQRGILMLREIAETGTFEWHIIHGVKSVEVPQDFEPVISKTITSLKSNNHRRRANIRSILNRFANFLGSHSVLKVSKVSAEDLQDYLLVAKETRPKSMDDVISALRNFFRCAQALGIELNTGLQMLSAVRCRETKVKPSFDEDELLAIFQQIDCSTPLGKRDYAILILEIYSGMRAGDIVQLRLKDIYWRDNEIRFVQGKTTQQLSLPLFKPVKDSIADYILNGRPESLCDVIFLRHDAPHSSFKDSGALNSMLQRYIKKAQISRSLNNGKTFHGLRRTLGTMMASNNVPATTIAQVLGHQSIRATRQYISMDLQGLERCVISMDSIGGGT